MGKAIEFYKFKKGAFGNHQAKGPWEVPSSFPEMVCRFKWMTAHTLKLGELMFVKFQAQTVPWADYPITDPEDTGGIYFKLTPELATEFLNALDDEELANGDSEHPELIEAIRVYGIDDPTWDYGISWDY